jgi:hypothetical protein
MIKDMLLVSSMILSVVCLIFSSTIHAFAQPILTPQQMNDAIDKEVTDKKAEADSLKAEIANTNLKNTGQVENLISKVEFFGGEVSVVGGGTWAYLHEVQDALLAKIKDTGQTGFTVAEQAAIDAFATDVTQSKLEHPSTNVFG